jgi:hypothetical protein
VREKLGDDLNITWKAFLLEQANSRRGDEWKAWKDMRFTSRDIPPHEAVKSVLATHGQEAFERYHIAVFRAYHLHKRDIANPLPGSIATRSGQIIRRATTSMTSLACPPLCLTASSPRLLS